MMNKQVLTDHISVMNTMRVNMLKYVSYKITDCGWFCEGLFPMLLIVTFFEKWPVCGFQGWPVL